MKRRTSVGVRMSRWERVEYEGIVKFLKFCKKEKEKEMSEKRDTRKSEKEGE